MFYDRFIELCEKNGVKPTPLVVSMGLSSSNVSIWKKGSTPRPAIVKKIADYFGVTTDYLLGGEQKEKPSTPEGEGLEGTSNYLKLTPENKAVVDALIAQLLKGQSDA